MKCPYCNKDFSSKVLKIHVILCKEKEVKEEIKEENTVIKKATVKKNSAKKGTAKKKQ